ADLGTTFDGDASYGAALIGYQFRTQALFLKLFAGVEAEDQSITPRDPENSVQGSAVGLKLGKLARPFAAVVPLRRWLVRIRVSAILELGAGGLSPFATLLAWAGRRRARQRGMRRGPWRRLREGKSSQPGAYALRRLHRKLSRRRTERLCVARRLSRLLRRTGCTAGPAPAVLSSSAWRFAE